MLKWTDKTDGIDDIMAEDVNTLAHSIIENENTAETKEDASAKLIEAKNYVDDNCWREWQAGIEYKVGDKVIVKMPVFDNITLEFLECKIQHTSSDFMTDLNNGYWEFNIQVYKCRNAETATIAMRAQADSDNRPIASTYATKTELSSYSQKPTIITDNTSTTYNLEFLGSTNKIIRLTAPALSELNLKFNNGEYNPDLLINLVFTSGETATHIIPQISFPNTDIINWIGTDCALSEGKSIFTPSANTRYDIVFSFDGSQLVGYVCGYTPATVSNV